MPTPKPSIGQRASQSAAMRFSSRPTTRIDLLETGGVEPVTGHNGRLIEVAGIQRTARTSKQPLGQLDDVIDAA